MRSLGAAWLCVLLVAACAACDESQSGTTAETAVATTAGSMTAVPPTPSTAPPTTSTTAPPTTTMPTAPESAAVLVTGADGVLQMGGDGSIAQLVVGPAAYAVDDTRGGLLFQIERGRKTFAGYEGEPPPAATTTIWWVPAGAAAPQQLLVPTPGAGHYLTLHDALAAGESFVVVYERHEGKVPFDGDMADTLRLFDVASQTVTEIYRTRGHEWYLGEVSSGGSLVAATEVQILGSGCRLLDRSGDLVTRPGFPSADEACFDESAECATSCALSSDAARVAYDWIVGLDNGVEWEVAVADMAGGEEIARFTLPVAGRWGPADLDIAGDQLLLNRAWEGIYDSPVLVVDVTEPGAAPLELPIAGRARFATAPVAIAAPVCSPGVVSVGADYYRFGDDGLYRVMAATSAPTVSPISSAGVSVRPG